MISIVPLTDHPRNIISPEAAKTLRQYASEAESLKQLHPAQLQVVYEQNWLRMLVPAQYGGLQWSLPNVVHMEEAIAWADGSTAWVVTLCAGANWFAGFLEPALAARLFADPHCCLAGSGRANAIAQPTGRGYSVSGTWPYASGAHHATAFTANVTLAAPEREALMSVLFLREEVTLQDTWRTMGLKATGSQSFSVENLLVPQERLFVIDTCHPLIDLPLYRFPFLQLAEATIAANMSGMALQFLDLAGDILQTSASSPAALAQYHEAQEQLMHLRHRFYAQLTDAWDAVCIDKIDDAVLTELSRCCRQLALQARLFCSQLYPFCGMAAANPSEAINRVFRDMHTASQHSLLRPF